MEGKGGGHLRHEWSSDVYMWSDGLRGCGVCLSDDLKSIWIYQDGFLAGKQVLNSLQTKQLLFILMK